MKPYNMIIRNPKKPLSSILVSFSLTIFFSSCLGPKKINKWVARHYDPSSMQLPKKKIDYLTVTTSLTGADIKMSETEKKTSGLVPLLFYWQYDYKNTCTLNPKIPVANFTSTVISYANSKGLKHKLNGRQVELSIDRIPNVFAVDDKGHLIWVIIYAFGWDVFTVQPQTDDMVVSYRILQDGTEAKKGVITIPNKDKTLTLKMFQSLRKKTWQYLDQYDENITVMSKRVIDQLITEL
ncbi:MAG: hypothetical protein JST87_13610 [Bacteroidetes bacterium]|nr:hypothetical protein [Bacteroidota bacterium]